MSILMLSDSHTRNEVITSNVGVRKVYLIVERCHQLFILRRG